jgi:predicted TPR repeat methyltransferase
MTLSPPNLEKALAIQSRLAAEHPGDARIFNDLGNLMVLSGKLIEAEQAYRRALELEPGRVTARFNLGLLLQQMGRSREAMAEYQKVVKADPAHAWAYYQIGTLHEKAQLGERAVRAYARAFSLDPQLAFAEVNPQVIDNTYLTEALLEADRQSAGAVLAPKAYEDPGRIAALLVPQVPAAEGEEMEDDADTEGEGEAETVMEEPVDAAGALEEAPRTLTEGDLDPDAKSNQAAPLTRSYPGRRGTTYRPPRTVRPPTTSQRQPIGPQAQPLRPQAPRVQRTPSGVLVVPGQQNTPRVPPQADQDNRGRVQIPAQPPTRFRPGLPSSGRLEMKLVPPGAAESETLAAG